VHRGNPRSHPKWKAIPALQASGEIGNLRYIHKIAVDEGINAVDLPAIGGTPAVTICQGPRRLHSQNAKLMVMGSMARLHNCASDDWEHLCDLIYIIGLGVPVVVASTWRIAGGDPSKLAAQASGITLHAPAAMLKPCTFLLDKRLSDLHPELHLALGHCAERPKSKWTVLLDKGRPLAANDVRVATIRALALAIFKLRTLHADGCRGYALGLK